jgi:hypothetical protein
VLCVGCVLIGGLLFVWCCVVYGSTFANESFCAVAMSDRKDRKERRRSRSRSKSRSRSRSRSRDKRRKDKKDRKKDKKSRRHSNSPSRSRSRSRSRDEKRLKKEQARVAVITAPQPGGSNASGGSAAASELGSMKVRKMAARY